jgi:hypothetical protein
VVTAGGGAVGRGGGNAGRLRCDRFMLVGVIFLTLCVIILTLFRSSVKIMTSDIYQKMIIRSFKSLTLQVKDSVQKKKLDDKEFRIYLKDLRSDSLISHSRFQVFFDMSTYSVFAAIRILCNLLN